MYATTTSIAAVPSYTYTTTTQALAHQRRCYLTTVPTTTPSSFDILRHAGNRCLPPSLPLSSPFSHSSVSTSPFDHNRNLPPPIHPRGALPLEPPPILKHRIHASSPRSSPAFFLLLLASRRSCDHWGEIGNCGINYGSHPSSSSPRNRGERGNTRD